ncbi:MAG: zinc transporter ZntB [Pseudomonadales bacterium]
MALHAAMLHAYAFTGDGRAQSVDSVALEGSRPQAGWWWVHLDRTRDEAEHWLRRQADLDPIAIDALLEEETRPRCVTIGNGLLVILRGVNLNVGADPADLVSVRLWVDDHQVVSLRKRRLMALQDLRDRIDRGFVPAGPGELLVEIAANMIDFMAPVLEELNDAVDHIEERVLDAPGHELRTDLSRLRRRAISLRRFLGPQREAFSQLLSGRSAIFTDPDRGRLRELTDRLTRYIEELDAARDRAAVTQEELSGRIADQMNRNMYVLSIVAGIFLPLGLLTGLLGINVGGIPGTENDWAFAIVCIVLVVLVGVAVWLFRRLKLI